jgi:hypothetical protein
MPVTFSDCFWKREKVYANNPHKLNELKQNINEAMISIEVSELKWVLNFSKALKFFSE